MIPPRDTAACLADTVRLRIKEQDRSAQNIDIHVQPNGYIIGAFDREGKMSEEEFRAYMAKLGFPAEGNDVRQHNEHLNLYNGEKGFFQVYCKE